MLNAWKATYLKDQKEFGSYPEKVREALHNEIRNNPGKWNVLQRGEEAIVAFFMAGPWRSQHAPIPDEDAEEEKQLSFFFVNGKRLPSDITYQDQTAGRSKMRTVAITEATIGQWFRSIELQELKNQQSAERITRNAALGTELLHRAGGDHTAKIIDNIDIAEAAD